MMKEVVVGIDIGGTNIEYSLVDVLGNIYCSFKIKTEQINEVEDLAKSIYDNLMTPKIQSEYKIKSIGIGAPNANYYNGCIEKAANLKWKGIVPIAEIFSNCFKLPVFITNDANAAAIGELMYGGAKGMKNFVEITIGTGLGSGIVVDGNLLHGSFGYAGEFGHIIAVEDGRPCGCGRNGCLETYVSARGVVKTYIELMRLANIEVDENNLSPRYISELALTKNDEIAKNAYLKMAKMLGEKLADLVAILEPQAIFLFGGVSNAGSLFVDETKNAMEKRLLPIYKNKIEVLASILLDNNAAILGSAALAWKSILSEHD